ncbi:MAG: hypothetical protein AB8B70_12180, partial [Prochlorococcus sp.]
MEFFSRASAILDDFTAEGGSSAVDLNKWQTLADLDNSTWASIRAFDFATYGECVLTSIRDGDDEKLQDLIAWDLQKVRQVVAAVLLITDQVSELLKDSIQNSPSLASVVSEPIRDAAVNDLLEPFQSLQRQLLSDLRDGDLAKLPNALVENINEIFNQNPVTAPLQLRGSLDWLPCDPSGPATYWLDLDFSGYNSQLNFNLELASLIRSATGLNLDPEDVPTVGAVLDYDLSGGVRVGLDLSQADASSSVVLDTSGYYAADGSRGVSTEGIDTQLLAKLDGFVPSRSELFVAATAAIEVIDISALGITSLDPEDFEELIKLEGAAFLDFANQGPGVSGAQGHVAISDLDTLLEVDADAALQLSFSSDVNGLLDVLQGKIDDLMNSLDPGEIGDCPQAWFAFINSFIDIVSSLSAAMPSSSTLPSWLPEPLSDGFNGFSAGLQQVANALSEFRTNVLDADAFVGLVNGLFAD